MWTLSVPSWKVSKGIMEFASIPLTLTLCIRAPRVDHILLHFKELMPLCSCDFPFSNFPCRSSLAFWTRHCWISCIYLDDIEKFQVLECPAFDLDFSALAQCQYSQTWVIVAVIAEIPEALTMAFGQCSLWLLRFLLRAMCWWRLRGIIQFESHFFCKSEYTYNKWSLLQTAAFMTVLCSKRVMPIW